MDQQSPTWPILPALILHTPTLPLAFSTLAKWCFFQHITYTRVTPFTESLHMLFPLHEFCLTPLFLANLADPSDLSSAIPSLGLSLSKPPD